MAQTLTSHSDFHISDLLNRERTRYGLRENSKKRVFELISEITSHGLPIKPVDIFERLLAREKLGSTGIGHGVAIPHARIHNLANPVATLVVLQAPVDFDALDKQPVDIFFTILVPENATEDHLLILSRIAHLLHEPTSRQQIREAGSKDALYQFIIDLDKQSSDNDD